MINIPKGCKDVLPDQSYKWHFIENTVRAVADSFCVREIRTPTFEHTELFLRGVGDTTDIVNKEMYTFEDKGNRSMTLKPEGTAGVARAFIENGLASTVMPMKAYYISPIFRYERPQAGRLREHHQFGVEFYGSDTPDCDAEVIVLAKTVLETLGLNVRLFINSMGCTECRKKYNAALKEFFREKTDHLCDTCKVRLEKNPLRLLDCKEEKCRAVNADAPKITDYLCEDCNEHFEKLKKLLTAANVEFTVDPRIVRGLDYYTKTVFEFVTTDLGAQGTVLGGGRYDGLVSELGGPKTSGIGFGMGIERALMLMEAKGVFIPQENAPEIYIASIGDNAYEKAFTLVMELRKAGVKCECDHMARGIKSQFKYADKIAAKYVLTIGENELIKNVAPLKRMSDGETVDISLDDVVERFTVKPCEKV